MVAITCHQGTRLLLPACITVPSAWLPYSRSPPWLVWLLKLYHVCIPSSWKRTRRMEDSFQHLAAASPEISHTTSLCNSLVWSSDTWPYTGRTEVRKCNLLAESINSLYKIRVLLLGKRWVDIDWTKSDLCHIMRKDKNLNSKNIVDQDRPKNNDLRGRQRNKEGKQ